MNREELEALCPMTPLLLIIVIGLIASIIKLFKDRPRYYKAIKDLKIVSMWSYTDDLLIKENTILKYDPKAWPDPWSIFEGREIDTHYYDLNDCRDRGDLIRYSKPLFNLRFKNMPRIFKLLFWTGLIILFYKFIFGIDQIILFLVSLIS